MTPPPCPTSSIPRNLLRPSQGGGVLQRFPHFSGRSFFLFQKKKTPPFPGGAQILQKMAVPTSWIFLANRQTSGRRRARNVGQTSGTSGELKVVETGKSPPKRTCGTEVEKLKKRNLSCDAKNVVKIRLSKHPKFEDVGRQFWENVWTGEGQRPQFWPGRIAFLCAVMCLWLQSLG